MNCELSGSDINDSTEKSKTLLKGSIKCRVLPKMALWWRLDYIDLAMLTDYKTLKVTFQHKSLRKKNDFFRLSRLCALIRHRAAVRLIFLSWHLHADYSYPGELLGLRQLWFSACLRLLAVQRTDDGQTDGRTGKTRNAVYWDRSTIMSCADKETVPARHFPMGRYSGGPPRYG